MDGGCEHPVVYKDGREERKDGDVQFLFLFNDCAVGVVCRQGITKTNFALANEG